MKKITAIEPQKNRNRVNIHLDGEFAFGLARITAAWLKVGDVLTEEKVNDLRNKDDSERALQQALLFLSYRARSEKEIKQNLLKHEYAEEIIEQTLEKLRESKLANDGQFAKTWVENRNTFRPRSKSFLAMELRQKGLNEETVKTAVANVDENALAYETAKKRANRFKSLERSEFRKKLSDFLARRGFPYSVVSSVVTQIWNELHTDDTLYEDEE
jgi:regulatory protein